MSIEDRVVTGGGSSSKSSKSLAARFGLRDKTCVVTGGTRGLGKAMCDAFGEMGAKHVITCSRKGSPQKSDDDDDQKLGWTHENTEFTHVERDVSKERDRDAFVDELYVVPEARGRGVGRAALAAAMRAATVSEPGVVAPCPVHDARVDKA